MSGNLTTGAVLAHSSGVGVRHAFVVEQVQQDILYIYVYI